MLPTRWASWARTSVLGLFRNAQPHVFRSEESSLPSGMGRGEGTLSNIYSAHSPVFTPTYGLFVFFNRLSTNQCATSYFFSLTSLTCYFSSFVQILKAHHFGAKMNKTWLFMMLGTDSTIHRFFFFLRQS